MSEPIPCFHCGVPIEWVDRWGAQYWLHVEMPDGMKTGGYIYCIDKGIPGSLLHVAEPPLSPDSGRMVVARLFNCLFTSAQAGRSPDRDLCHLCGKSLKNSTGLMADDQSRVVHIKCDPDLYYRRLASHALD